MGKVYEWFIRMCVKVSVWVERAQKWVEAMGKRVWVTLKSERDLFLTLLIAGILILVFGIAVGRPSSVCYEAAELAAEIHKREDRAFTKAQECMGGYIRVSRCQQETLGESLDEVQEMREQFQEKWFVCAAQKV